MKVSVAIFTIIIALVAANPLDGKKCAIEGKACIHGVRCCKWLRCVVSSVIIIITLRMLILNFSPLAVITITGYVLE